MRRLSSLGACLAALTLTVVAQHVPAPGSPPGVEIIKFMWAEVGYPGGSCDDCPGLPEKAVEYRWESRKYKYVALAEVLNGGAKAIKAVELDFVFADAATEREQLRYRVRSELKISPGQKKEVRKLVRDVKVEGSNYRPANPSRELLSLTASPAKLVVMRVEYADGSIWQRP